MHLHFSTTPWAVLGCWGRGASQGKPTEQELGFHNPGWAECNSVMWSKKTKSVSLN